MKKIVFFNHKGGVSKTTTAYHLGWMIAEKGHKVLLVDADPQCNLSALILGDKFDSYYEEEQTKYKNIMDGVKPAFSGSPTPIEAIECVKAPRNENLFLLPGHMNLSEYDAQLNFAFTASQTMISLQNLPGAFNDFITKTAEAIGAEYVFIDLNPGLSTINEDLFLISDAFIVPTNPDTFSLMALKSLASILPRWVTWKKNFVGAFSASAYPLPVGTPKFIGEIPQRFNIRNGVATTPFRINLEALASQTTDVFVPALKNMDMMFTEEEYTNAGIDTNSFFLEEIKDFQGLAPKSSRAHVPVFALTDEELETKGAALEAQQANRDVFRRIYSDIADKVISILQ